MFKLMRAASTRFKCWLKKNSNYRRSRKISDHRAMNTAQKLLRTGVLQSSRHTGCPLLRDYR